ncbi:FAD:protein FMN transferase [Caldanaerovirga acetigignens]|uniref:FAD:protein FMN transferase n=1 Tax=Caldanaerovirga acetigignens TaxID=447595 RepID=UPI0009330BA4
MRRRILTCIILSALIFILTSCSRSEDKPVVKTNFQLDTLIKISAYGDGASEAIDAAFERIGQIDKKMNARASDSEVTAVNEAAGKNPVKVSSDTFFVIKRGLYFSDLSGGKFDITVGPLVNLWGIGTDKAHVPEKSEIIEALKLINYRDVLLDENEKTIMLKKPGMAIDLGGIAKGYAADEVIKVLKERGMKSAVADLGGNVYVLGRKPNGQLWKIGIQDPFKPRGEIFATIEAENKTLVTSGVYERFFEEGGKRYHHILDTLTGYPVENGLVSVTIIGNSSIDADALSTAVFSLGLQRGMELVENLPDIEAIFVTKDKEVYVSSGVKELNFKITDNDYTLKK